LYWLGPDRQLAQDGRLACRRRAVMRSGLRRPFRRPFRPRPFLRRRFHACAVLPADRRRHLERQGDATPGPERRNPDCAPWHHDL